MKTILPLVVLLALAHTASAGVPSYEVRSNVEPGMLMAGDPGGSMDVVLGSRGAPDGIASTGAISRNTLAFSDVAAQRDALWALRYAVRNEDDAAVSKTLLAVEYAFSHQNGAGFFENDLGLTPVEALAADVFFMAAYGQFHHLVSRTRYWSNVSRTLTAKRSNVRAAMHWLAANSDELLRQDRDTPNRLLFDALAFILNGQILDDPSLVDIGHMFLQKAVVMQHAEGYFLEKGGFDSSYQAVSLLNLAAITQYARDSGIAQEASTASSAGVSWLLTRIRKNGSVSRKGNTRTGRGGEVFFGRKKGVNYSEVIYALLQWDALGDGDYSAQAAAVTGRLKRRLHLR